ncbi:ribosomal-protein-alanine N-acetyltransferase [Flavobacteriaceae bacterium UJ101]|nr:ribosomal-protein-alanine N-acetyltransferase [Flavobacteriaceae bacterium UJ101]
MMIFKTKRLIVRDLIESDRVDFYDMMGNPKVMNPIPMKILTKVESDQKFDEFVNLCKQKSEKKIWAVILENEFIGICGLIKNNENEDEIAYRFREKHWGLGYGTEIAEGLLKYGFEKLNSPIITADVFIENKQSMKIIEKFMEFHFEFFSKEWNCMDRRYKITRSEWLKRDNIT